MNKVLMGALAGLLPAAALLATPALAAAKPARAAAAAIPDQPWYPPGYRDLKIAAGETMRLFPRFSGAVLEPYNDTKTYGVVDCRLADDLPKAVENPEGWRGLLALDVARMRSEFRKLGYRPEIYDRALLDHERASLAYFARVKPEPVWIESDTAADGAEPPAEVVEPPAEDVLPPEEDVEPPESPYYDWSWGHQALAAEMEAKRQRLQPGKPRIVYEDRNSCGGGQEEFTVVLSPANGRLWLINAFAFKVCERKVPNPWDHRACGWNEFATGEKSAFTGRYMYEARWPGGAVRRGAKLLEETYRNAAIVIRRN